MTFYLVKSDDVKFRYFFQDHDKANVLYQILKERYHNKAEIVFKTIETSDNKDLAAIMDEILIKED